jgi:hypothetical protein
MAKHLAHVGEKINACRVLVEKAEEKMPLGKCTHRWKDNIKKDFSDT